MMNEEIKKKGYELLKSMEGKVVVRTRSVRFQGLHGVYNSFTTNPIEIVHVTQSHIVYIDNYYSQMMKDKNLSPLTVKRNLHILDEDYIDENWTDYDDIIDTAFAKLKARYNINDTEAKVESDINVSSEDTEDLPISTSDNIHSTNLSKETVIICE